MKIFHCDHCEQLVFFENTQCMKCGHALAYLPDLETMASLEPVKDDVWMASGNGLKGRRYRLCLNYSKENVCNWAMPAEDPHKYCRSCLLTRVIPNIEKPENRVAWVRLESAKRRLIFTLLRLHLPTASKTEDPKTGLAFEFLEDVPAKEGEEAKPVLTGHDDGVIVVNIAEADDAARESRKKQMNEPYRTLLGHFRHEVGHYYWDRLIRDSKELAEFRRIFGDESQDYGEALKVYYQNGPPEDWRLRLVSAYAAAHPWEDWAESWAHYLHMLDTLETASCCGLSLRPKRRDEPMIKTPPKVRSDGRPETFHEMTDAWYSLTYVLNNLNRGMGLPDAYPFILSTPAIEKLHYIHRVVGQAK